MILVRSRGAVEGPRVRELSSAAIPKEAKKRIAL
jgi:hypothetical protein